MVVTSILSTDAEMLAMAGSDVNTTGFSDANKTAWGIQAEAIISALGHYDFPTNVGTLSAKIKGLLSEYVARYVAVGGLTYNPLGQSGGKNRIQFEDEIQIHLFRMRTIEKLMSDSEALTELGVV